MFTALEWTTGAKVIVEPIAICESDACDTLLIADANTGKGLWMGYDLNWQIDLKNGNLNHDAEKIEGVYGADEDEWEAAANKLLANYGFKLGAFNEEAGGRYELIEA